MTRLSDAANAAADFLMFDVGPDPVTVYVAYDALGRAPTSTSHVFNPVVLTSDIQATGRAVTDFALVRAEGVTGTVRLGGNRSGGAPMSRETYLVIVSP